MKRTYTTILHQNEKIIVDGDSGEVIKTETNTTMRFPSEPEFIKLYVKDILYLSDMPQACNKVLLSLLAKAKYADKTTINSADSGGLVVSMSGYDRKQLMQETGFVRMSSFNNILAQLVKGKLLIRLGTGTYQLNPYLFGKGNWRDIQELRMKVTYNLSGKTFKTEVDRRVSNSRFQYPAESDECSGDTIQRSPITLSPEEKRLLKLLNEV